MSRACYVLRFLLADRKDLRTAYYRAYGRVAIIATTDVLTTLPEYHFLPQVYDQGTPGVGAIPIAPVSSAQVENVLCLRNDTHGKEDILLREIAQGVFHLAARYVLPGLEDRLKRLYDRAMASGWWRNTYAALTPDSYFVSPNYSPFIGSLCHSFRKNIVVSCSTRLYSRVVVQLSISPVMSSIPRPECPVSRSRSIHFRFKVSRRNTTHLPF